MERKAQAKACKSKQKQEEATKSKQELEFTFEINSVHVELPVNLNSSWLPEKRSPNPSQTSTKHLKMRVSDTTNGNKAEFVFECMIDRAFKIFECMIDRAFKKLS